MNKIKFLFIIVLVAGVLAHNGVLLANEENIEQEAVVLVDTKEEKKSVSDASSVRGLEIESRLSKREELDRLLLVLKKRKEALDSIGELEDRNDVPEIERTLREEIDQLLIKIQRLAAELNEGNIQELDDEQNSGWVTTTLVCSSLFLISSLALATMDPFEGIKFPPSTKRFEKNMERILKFF